MHFALRRLLRCAGPTSLRTADVLFPPAFWRLRFAARDLRKPAACHRVRTHYLILSLQSLFCHHPAHYYYHGGPAFGLGSGSMDRRNTLRIVSRSRGVLLIPCLHIPALLPSAYLLPTL